MQSKSLEECMGIENFEKLRAQFFLKFFKLLKTKSRNGEINIDDISISEILCICCECAKEHSKIKNDKGEYSDYELTLSYFMWQCGENYHKFIGPMLTDDEKI